MCFKTEIRNKAEIYNLQDLKSNKLSGRSAGFTWCEPDNYIIYSIFYITGIQIIIS
jgi:hypothetical protein